jgi:hypothetical protein
MSTITPIANGTFGFDAQIRKADYDAFPRWYAERCLLLRPQHNVEAQSDLISTTKADVHSLRRAA